MNAESLRTHVVLVVVLVVVGACAPFGLKGDDCQASPCAAGLVCSDGFCSDPPPPPPPPCTDDTQCALDGDGAGRVCTDGVCGFADCAFDLQCGTRICVDGSCADGQLCLNDDGCTDQLCIDNVCRDPCFVDDDCGLSLGGIGLQLCVDGRCQQRCLGDFTCLGGGICVDGSCTIPDCAESSDCNDEARFCEAGRCTNFTTCGADGDCFDPNLFCNIDVEPVRCDERPACRADSECGLGGLCLDRHCRPAESCFVDDDCLDQDDECIASRCVNRPDCRGDVDCANGRICSDLRCIDAPTAVGAAFVVVADRLGSCDPSCTRVVFVGEELAMHAQGFDVDGNPVAGAVRANPVAAVTIISAVDNLTRARAQAAGTASLEFGNVIVTLIVHDATAPLSVLVTETDGSPVAAVDVEVAGVSVPTNAAGLATFDPRPVVVGEGLVIARFGGSGSARSGGRTTIVPLNDAATTVRLVLPPARAPDLAAALRVTITSTGDEVGPVGIGFALPALNDAKDVSLPTLFGDVTQGEVILPVIGALPIAVSSAMTLNASLPLVGEQVVRAQAQVRVAAGPAFVTAWEDRREQQDLVALALAADPTNTVLDFVETSESMDTEIINAGVVIEQPLVTDVSDRDGDGDTTELIPDFVNAPAVEARPSAPPRERTSVIAAPPVGANERALVVVGFALPGRFVVAGAGVVRGALGFEDVPLPEPLKAIPGTQPLQTAPRVIVVSAVFDDVRLSSRARFQAAGFALPPIVDIGPLLPVPEGAFLLRDVPDDGDVSVIVPANSAALLLLTLRDLDGGVVFFWVENDGAARLPLGFLDVSLEEVRAYDTDESPFAVGAGPIDIERSARRVASAPGG